MPLIEGPSLGGNARHVLRQYAEENFNARTKALNASGVEEFGGGCLRARYNNLREVVQATPSLVVVPSLTKGGTLFTNLPSSTAGDFTVTRDTTARRVNSSGNIESVASGVPRIDWLGQSCPSLLVEASAQNLAFHSEAWTAGSNWNLNAVTRATGSTDAFKAPDGTFTANALSPTSGNASHTFQSNASTPITYTSGTIYTQSAFFKAGAGDAGRYVQLSLNGTIFSQLFFANFDLQDGIITATGSISADANRNARIEDYGNGWYRCSLTATCNVNSSNVGIQIILITASGDARSPSFAGTVTDVLYGWGAQLETGSVATTYIPTTTGSGTRNADVITASGALVSGLIPNNTGSIEFEFQAGASFPLYVYGLQATVSGLTKVRFDYSPTVITLFINGVQATTQTGTYNFSTLSSNPIQWGHNNNLEQPNTRFNYLLLR